MVHMETNEANIPRRHLCTHAHGVVMTVVKIFNPHILYDPWEVEDRGTVPLPLSFPFPVLELGHKNHKQRQGEDCPDKCHLNKH